MRSDTISLILLKLDILSHAIWLRLRLETYILLLEIAINPNVREWKIDIILYIVDIFTNCGLIYYSY